MTASQKSRLGQGVFFGVFFIVLGLLMRFWTERGTAPFNGGTTAIVVGIVLMLWGGFSLFRPGKSG